MCGASVHGESLGVYRYNFRHRRSIHCTLLYIKQQKQCTINKENILPTSDNTSWIALSTKLNKTVMLKFLKSVMRKNLLLKTWPQNSGHEIYTAGTVSGKKRRFCVSRLVRCTHRYCDHERRKQLTDHSDVEADDVDGEREIAHKNRRITHVHLKQTYTVRPHTV